MATLNQKKVTSKILEQVRKGEKVSVSKAMRESGVYSQSVSKQPHRITKSKGFIEILEKAGLSDSFLARKHSQLANSTRLEKDTFYADPIIETKRKKEKVVGWTHVSDAKIKLLIEGTAEEPTGNRVAYIKKFDKHKEVFFRVPDNAVQSKALEMGYKIKDLFAADKLDIVEHEMNDDEKSVFDSIFKNNKK